MWRPNCHRQTDTETTKVLDVDGDEVNDCVTVSYGVSTTLAMPDTGQAWFEGYGIRAQMPTDSPAYEGPDDENNAVDASGTMRFGRRCSLAVWRPE